MRVFCIRNLVRIKFILLWVIAVSALVNSQSLTPKPQYKLLSVQGVAGFIYEVNKVTAQGYRIKFIRFERPQEASELAFSRTLITVVFESHPKSFTYSAAMLDVASNIDDWLSLEAHEGAKLVTVCGFLHRAKDAIYEGEFQKEVEVVNWTNMLLTEREDTPREVSKEFRVEKYVREEAGQKQLAEAAQKGFHPTNAFITMEARKLSLGIRVPLKTIVLERGYSSQTPAPLKELKVLETHNFGTLEREINDLAKNGWSVDTLSSNLNLVFLTKKDPKIQRKYLIKKMPLDEKKFLFAFRASLDEAKQANLRYVGMVGARMDAVVYSNEPAPNRSSSKPEYKLISFIESKANTNPPTFEVSRLREMQILLDSAIVDGYELRDLVVAENTKILVMVKTK
jgi:hypothetical protein